MSRPSVWSSNRRVRMTAVFGAVLGIPFSNVTVAFAQQSVGDTTGGAQVQGTTPQGTTPTGTTTTTSTTSNFVGNPYQPPGNGSSTSGPAGPIGGGNATESSSRTVTGDQSDSFDLGTSGAGGASGHGDANGPIFMGNGGAVGGEVPYQHIVRKGDTLSGICDNYFHNPYQWPRVWSYNPQIQNPHWIYPGDLIRLRSNNGPVASTALNSTPGMGSIVDRRRQVPADTVFLRDEGYIEDHSDQDWGEITGAPEDKMFLTDGDEIYLHVGGDREVKIGQELTIFRPVRDASSGKVIQLLGTVRLNDWNPEDRVARGRIIESLDVIERGSRVGPIGRRFQVVPPVRNLTDVSAAVVASVHPHNFYGQNQVVFIDKGEADGLKVGNRLFILRRGDAWRRSLATPGAAYRISPESTNLPDMEKTPGTKDEGNYPQEVVGELRILEARPHSSTCLVTQSRLEIENSDIAVARRGY